jgi:hypothetical protein
MHNSTAVTTAKEYYLIDCNLRFFRCTTTDHLVVVQNAAKSKATLNKRLFWEQLKQIILFRKKLRAD